MKITQTDEKFSSKTNCTQRVYLSSFLIKVQTENRFKDNKSYQKQLNSNELPRYIPKTSGVSGSITQKIFLNISLYSSVLNY